MGRRAGLARADPVRLFPRTVPPDTLTASTYCGGEVMTVVAIIAQGMMGAGVGRRLHENGAEVRPLLSGRSAKSAERARAAGMQPAADQQALLAGADFFLSILPPGEAEALARQLGATLE